MFEHSRILIVGAVALFSNAGRAQCAPEVPTQELAAPDAATGDAFGAALAVTQSGDLAVVGAPRKDNGGRDSGAVYVFARSAAGFQFKAQLVAPDAQAGARFGAALSVTPDGSRLIVGAPGHSGNGSQAGAAYVWLATPMSPSGWLLEAQFQGDAFDALGSAVLLSINGEDAFAGAPGYAPPGASGFPCAWFGRVHAFERSGGTWSSAGEIGLGSAALSDGQYGTALALSDDGTRLFVGDYRFECGFGATVGAVNILAAAPGGGWTLDEVLSGQLGEFFTGRSLAISGLGDELVVGVPRAHGTLGFTVGMVSLYEDLSANGWTETERLFASDGETGDDFGWSLARSADGQQIFVGAPGDDDQGPDAGAVYRFERDTGVWSEVAKLAGPSAASGDAFGQVVALTGAADVLLASSPAGDAGVLDGGSVAVFEPLPVTTYCSAKLSSGGCLPAVDYAGTPSSQGGLFLVSCRQVPNGKNGLFFYGLGGPAAIPFLGGTLCAVPPLKRTATQNSGGNPPPMDDCSGGFLFFANAWFAAGSDPNLTAGSQVNGQYWFRDPQQTDGTGVELSDAIEFAFCD